jgi:hypothetical protein
MRNKTTANHTKHWNKDKMVNIPWKDITKLHSQTHNKYLTVVSYTGNKKY